ncbi:hypothetical protein GCM10010172_65930 [Paractinoplanes ferrugineus]|uniref:Glycosyltransferase 2-like domain-containing protein n=1 Tax=Paractinoplanes ferrugineus TaxID=113564 RepID=A0A919MB36_9ACTN|nr:glycosyltransferase [Actinoplanes ferrugineus]GIE13246.1 hypothetical protein Afe05nite_50860 [Actinoplanes ferrugineus]
MTPRADPTEKYAGDVPGLSVIVPVKDRVTELRRLLESIRRTAADHPFPIEVIVVDDSAPDAARQHAMNCDRLGARYLRGPRHVGAKRNVGARHADHGMLLFVDSDCQVTDGLFNHHYKTLRSAPDQVVAVAGPTRLIAGAGRMFEVARRSRRLNNAFDMPLEFESVGWATTSNLAVRKEAWNAVGGFPEDGLTVVAGEDVDFCLRLVRAGYRIVCDPEAVVLHDAGNSSSFSPVLRRLYTYGRSGSWLGARYPELRRWKVNPIVAVAATYALAKTLPTTRRRGGLLAAGVAAGILAIQSVDRRRGPTREETGYAVLAALLDWSADWGEAVAAVQLRRPGLLLTGFGWRDDPAFVPRAAVRPDDA